ncbi:hypothetical protein K0U00_47285, partial [Paenibacillus sepulcri]|nr:hypothetical protein [Paenibacillus sepulcri]
LAAASVSSAPAAAAETDRGVSAVHSGEGQPAVPEFVEPLAPAEIKPTIRSRYLELFELHDGGKSVDSIARKLAMNKGEVQLILQLSKQEEAARYE